MKKSLLFIFILNFYIGVAQCVDPIITNFECSPPSQTITGALTTIANPVSGGINTSANVGEYTDDGTQGFDALVIDYGTAIDLSTNSVLKLKLYAPTSVQILAKLEGGTAVEIFSDFSAVNTWQEFQFDFSASAAAGNTTVVLFVNPGVTTGTPTDIYYLDDLRFDAPASPACEEPVITDFECSAASQPITGALVTVANPVSGGINTSANVGQYTDDGTQGFDALIIDYGAAIDLSSNSIFKLKFYSPSSVQILAKLEGSGNPANDLEIYTDFSAVDTWEEFVFDFSAAQGNGNTKLVLFFNPTVTTGTPTDIYYIDDLLFDSTLSLEEITLDEKIVLYPNPTTNQINISSAQTIDNYQIFNVLGKTVLTDNSENISNTVDVSALKSGIYFITINTEISRATIKFIKQ